MTRNDITDGIKAIRKLIPVPSTLRVVPYGFVVAANHTYYRNKAFVSNKLLSVIDARLPAALRYAAKRNDNKVHSRHIDELVNLWNLDIQVKMTNGDFAAFRKVQEIIMGIDSLKIRGTGVAYFIHSQKDFINVPMPSHDLPILTNVDVEWMDINKSGWRKRFKIADDLGMTPEDILRSMLDKPTVDNSISLPNDVAQDT